MSDFFLRRNPGVGPRLHFSRPGESPCKHPAGSGSPPPADEAWLAYRVFPEDLTARLGHVSNERRGSSPASLAMGFFHARTKDAMGTAGTLRGAGPHPPAGRVPPGHPQPGGEAAWARTGGVCRVTQTPMTDPGVPSLSSAQCHVGLFGCPLDTGNLGVTALGLSAIDGLTSAGRSLQLTVFDYGRGVRELSLVLAGSSIAVRLVGCYYSRRLYRPDNLAQMYFAARLGQQRTHPMLRRLRKLDAILDVSGGDSFSDIYGGRRFRSVTLPKLLAIRLGIPLVLLPQTYGPYSDLGRRSLAAEILRDATQVWSRDERSLAVARSLLSERFDPVRHRGGVDLAFSLRSMPPAKPRLHSDVQAFVSESDLVIGLNVSGLLYQATRGERARYGISLCYRTLMKTLLKQLLGMNGLRVLLIPHVAPSAPSRDCDLTACREIHGELSTTEAQRVFLVPRLSCPMEMKWIIGHCDWFCGTRMHSCVAALSQGIATAAVAYSDKTLGVFETVGSGECVVDARRQDASEVIQRLLSMLERREGTTQALRSVLPAVQQRSRDQFAAIVGAVP